MTTIVSEADFLDNEEDVRIVQLAASYGYDIAELYANISPQQVRLRRLSSDKQPKTAVFSASEMDALCEAWMQFKADREKALDAEEARKQEVVKQALALAESVDGIKVEWKEDAEVGYNTMPGWEVTHPGKTSTWVYGSSDGLLSGVRTAIDEWGEFLLQTEAELHSHRKLIQDGDERKWLTDAIRRCQEWLDKYGHVLKQLREQGNLQPVEPF